MKATETLTMHSDQINQLLETADISSTSATTVGRSQVWTLKNNSGTLAVVRYPNGRFKKSEFFPDLLALKANIASGLKLSSLDKMSTESFRTVYNSSVAAKNVAHAKRVVLTDVQVTDTSTDTVTEVATETLS